jgi:hypothetical protein
VITFVVWAYNNVHIHTSANQYRVFQDHLLKDCFAHCVIWGFRPKPINHNCMDLFWALCFAPVTKSDFTPVPCGFPYCWLVVDFEVK